MSKRGEEGAPEPRPSQVFAAKLRDIRKNRGDGFTQEELARKMTDAGHPMSTLTLARIEKGERVPTLDETLALAQLLYVAPAYLLSPSGGNVWLTDKIGVDGAGMRNFLLLGDPLLLTPPGRRTALRFELANAIEKIAQAIVDARRGNDEAGVLAGTKALKDVIDGHREQLAAVESDESGAGS